MVTKDKQALLFIAGWILCGFLNVLLLSKVRPEKSISLGGAIVLVGTGGLGLIANSIAVVLIDSPCVINCRTKDE